MTSFPATPASKWAALTLIAIQCLLLAHTAWDKSDTVDEGTYITRAAQQWSHGEFFCTGALPQWAYAVGLRLAEASFIQVPKWRRPESRSARFNLLVSRPDEMRRMLLAARLPSIIVTLLGGWWLWRAGLRFGSSAAAITLALWCFSPTVLANGSLATLDIWVAAMLGGAILATMRAVESPTAARSGIAGAVLGLACASKYTALPAVPLACALIAWSAARTGSPRGTRRGLMCSAAATAACAGTVWAIYGFGIGEVHGAKLCGMPLVSELWPRDAGPLPAPRWFEGLLAQLSHGYVQGHRNDLFGEISTGGWWWYYLAALAFKTTLGAQGLFVLRAGSLLLGRVSHWRIDVALLAFPLLLLLALSAARTQNGIMYLLPAYPCALLFLGRAFSDDNGVQPGWRRAVAWVLVGTCAVGALSQHPHHLMFFNYWAGGPEHGPALMSHRSDWGQDKRRLGEWQREHGVSVLNYVPFGNGRAVGAWGIRHRVPDCEPAPGVFALHAVHVYRPSEKRRGCFDWLTVEPPDERLGYSIYLYRVDESRIAALAGKRGHTTPFHRSAREHPR